MTANIMVAGKSAANVQLVKEAIGDLDYQVIPAPAMSLALFLARKNLPELILCDREMIDGDARAFLDELRADDELRRIPFMLLAPREVSSEEHQSFMKSGAALVLSADISARELLGTIEPYINARLDAKPEREIETSE